VAPQLVLQLDTVRVFAQRGEGSAMVREVPAAAPRPVPPSCARPVPRAPRRLLAAVASPVGAALAISAVMLIIVFGILQGYRYYLTPIEARGSDPMHRVLRPSGSVGLWLGISGATAMVLMQLYSARKRAKVMSTTGAISRWLDLHILGGVLGPILITLHTSFKFNGIVSVAYWSMVLVMLSGFVGRYLYARIPKSLRGQELTHEELLGRADDLKLELLDAHYPTTLGERVEEFERQVIPAAESAQTIRGLIWGDIVLRWRLQALRSQLAAAGFSGHTLEAVAGLAARRATLLRRIAYLRKTKQLFDLWHVLHRPLAVVMAVVVVLHVGAALYLGYAFGAR
jgi:hypothetical protein